MRLGLLEHHKAQGTQHSLAPRPTLCHTGLWTWKHPSWDTAGEDPDVTPN